MLRQKILEILEVLEILEILGILEIPEILDCCFALRIAQHPSTQKHAKCSMWPGVQNSPYPLSQLREGRLAATFIRPTNFPLYRIPG